MQQLPEILICLILSVTKITLSSDFDCFRSNEDYKCKLAVKTPYRFIANYDDFPLQYPGCNPKKIWMVLRHGTRYPGEKYIIPMVQELPRLQKLILENHQRSQTQLSDEDAALLQNWKITFAKDDAMKLAEEGENEMIDLAERYQSRFPSLMPQVYNNLTYKFKYTATQRTEESARHFTAGLFGWHNSKKVWYPEAEHKDPVLRFYKRCSRWVAEVDENPNAQYEKEMFLKNEVYLKMLHNISKRIGHQVDHETVRLMSLMCGFETAWKRNVASPWCKMFSSHDFQILEFAEDLDYYWIDGYGYKLTYEQACPALKDMFDFFSFTNGPTVSAYFTHSGTVLKILALLGVAKDDRPLTHDLFSFYADKRAWKTGIIDAFASNIAFILYECLSGPSILFMHQERPKYLEGCPLHKPCPLSIMKALYPDHDKECQFEEMCRVVRSDGES